MSELGEIERRTELERARADGRREALADVLQEIDSMAGNELYRRAWKKIALRIYGLLKAVNASITQAS